MAGAGRRANPGRGLGTVAVGGLLVAIWLGGHGALYSAYRITETHAPAVVAEVSE